MCSIPVGVDFWVHSNIGAVLQGYKVTGYGKSLLRKQMVVTLDVLGVGVLTDDSLIAFVPIGPMKRSRFLTTLTASRNDRYNHQGS